MKSIQKIFTDEHIDLDKVVLISDAYFIDRMGSGGWYVGFHIIFQLMDDPVRYTREFAFDEYKFTNEKGHELIYADNSPEILAVHRYQKQIDKVIKMWKEYKNG